MTADGPAMTEADWLACADPEPLLELVRHKASDRKIRLFAVACCRRVWSSFEHEEFRDAVRKAEAFADGLADRAEMLAAHEKARPIFPKLHDGKDNGPGAALTASSFPGPPKSLWDRIADALDDPWWEDELDKGDPLGVALVTARHAAWAAAVLQNQKNVSDAPATLAERREQAALVRCVFGNPFRPQPESATSLTREIGDLAEVIYAERAFDRMPLLADALEASGGTSADLIEHCRSGREHERGCWVLDLLLTAPARGAQAPRSSSGRD
jgi:hypothetical protein